MIGYFSVATIIIYALGGADSRHLPKTDLNYKGSTRTKCPETVVADNQSIGSTTIPMQLRQLRAEMKHMISVEGPPLDGYIVTSDDDHQSETVAPRDARRAFISGFSGSFGDAVITQDSAVLWTSKLYREQADRQLSCHWNLMITDDEKIPTLFEWLVFKFQFSERRIRIGADPELVPASTWKSWQQATLNATVTLVAVRNNLIDIIWQNDRPSYNTQPAFVLEGRFAGRSWQDKIQEVRVEMKNSEADALIVTALDEIAWLLNIRGYDVPYTPVLRSYLVVTLTAIHLYAPPEKLFRPVHVHLRTDGCFNADCVRPHKYASIWDDLTTMAQAWDRAWIPDSCGSARGASQKIATSIPADRRLIKVSPIIRMRARKNPVEVEGLQRAHIRDAASMCEFLFYMEEQISLGSEGWDELQAARLADELRLEKDEIMGIAFATIAGYGRNGAIPRYEDSEATNLNIGDTSTLVVDSGGQYKDGTTDVTRTMHYGKPSSEQKEAYTRVLIGSIQLASLVFPASLRTDQLDALVRQPLWAAGFDYHHPTGYGIGHFLSVHEAPIAVTYDTPISTNATCNAVQLEPGHFFTNKPGFYREGEFGVRLGNVLQVVDAYPTANFQHKFRKFNDVTLVPYEPKLIETNMLSSSHRLWLNEYNKRIRKVIGDELRAQRLDKVLEWMMNKTESIPQLEGSKPDIFIPPAVDSSSFPRLTLNYFILSFIFHIFPFRNYIS